MTIRQEIEQLLARLGVPADAYSGGALAVRSPITGEIVANVVTTTAPADAILQAHHAFLAWREVPTPRRGELVRLLGEELRAERETLGRLVTLEAGKITSEGLGE